MFEFWIDGESAAARSGSLTLPHGTVETPVFIPVVTLEGFRGVDEDGVEFQSHVDGGRRKMTPETAIDIQAKLGSDITMAFDHVIPGGADEATARDALDRTLRWLARCKKRHDELKTNEQTLWPIIQGGTLPALRTESLDRILELGPWTGIAIGGLSVGEPKDKMYA